VLGKGEIIEEGPFNGLIRAQGPFAALYQSQFGLDEQGRAIE
jgi:ABC-type multidrug transport system fused ATPase/permease subunit